MARKRNKNILTPYECDVIKIAKSKPGELITLSYVQRITGMSFLKACEIVKKLSDDGLIKSNINELNITS